MFTPLAKKEKENEERFKVIPFLFNLDPRAMYFPLLAHQYQRFSEREGPGIEVGFFYHIGLIKIHLFLTNDPYLTRKLIENLLGKLSKLILNIFPGYNLLQWILGVGLFQVRTRRKSGPNTFATPKFTRKSLVSFPFP